MSAIARATERALPAGSGSRHLRHLTGGRALSLHDRDVRGVRQQGVGLQDLVDVDLASRVGSHPLDERPILVIIRTPEDDLARQKSIIERHLSGDHRGQIECLGIRRIENVLLVAIGENCFVRLTIHPDAIPGLQATRRDLHRSHLESIQHEQRLKRVRFRLPGAHDSRERMCSTTTAASPAPPSRSTSIAGRPVRFSTSRRIINWPALNELHDFTELIRKPSAW